MNRICKVVVSAILATTLHVGSAVAGEGLEGFTIGIVSNNADFTTYGKEIEGLGSNPQILEEQGTTVKKSVDFPSVFIDYTWVQGFGAMTVGLEYISGTHSIGSGSRTDTQSDAQETSDDSGTYTASADVKDLATLYFEPALHWNDAAAIYLKGGVSHMTVMTNESITFGADSARYGNQDVFAGMYGVGVKGLLPWGIMVKLEATKTVYPEISFTSQSGNINKIIAQPEYEAVRFAIGYNF